MQTFLTVLHIVVVLLISVMVLLQRGKGAEMSSNLGGSTQSVLGSSGGASFFMKFTFFLGALFVFTSITLTMMGARAKRSVFDSNKELAVPMQTTPAVPATEPVAPSGEAAKAPVKKADVPAKKTGSGSPAQVGNKE